MDVTPLVKQDTQIIQSYAGGQFRISGDVYQGAVIVTPEHTVSWDFSGTVADLSINDFALLIQQSNHIDVVLLGCGSQIQFLSPMLKGSLKDKGLSIDVMDTGAACRTYNVLVAEGRRVATALLPFE